MKMVLESCNFHRKMTTIDGKSMIFLSSLSKLLHFFAEIMDSNGLRNSQTLVWMQEEHLEFFLGWQGNQEWRQDRVNVMHFGVFGGINGIIFWGCYMCL